MLNRTAIGNLCERIQKLEERVDKLEQEQKDSDYDFLIRFLKKHDIDIDSDFAKEQFDKL